MTVGATGSVTDTLEFDAATGNFPWIIHISGDVFAIAYTGPGGGWLCTVTIDSDGEIGDTVVDTLEFDASRAATPTIVKVSGNIYAIAYDGVDSDGWVCTVDIDSSGNIGDTVVDSHEFEAGEGHYPFIIHISGTVFVIAYHDANRDGWLKTLNINADGTIDASPEIESLEFDTTEGAMPRIILVSGNIYAIAYQGIATLPTRRGIVATVSITNAGAIGDTVIDSLIFEAGGANGLRTSIAHLSGSIFVIACCIATSSTGKIYTVDIDGVGTIGNSVLGTLTYDTVSRVPSLIKRAANLFAVAYQGVDFDGWLKTFQVSPDGTISAVLASAEFDNADCNDPVVINRPGSLRVYAIAYSGPQSDGFLKTFVIASGTVWNEFIFPSDAVARPSSIRHIFRPGLFVMQAGLGALGFDIDIAKTAVRSELDTAKTPDGTVKEQIDKAVKQPDIIPTISDIPAGFDAPQVSKLPPELQNIIEVQRRRARVTEVRRQLAGNLPPGERILLERELVELMRA
ncbi:hypothetical protein LCGC14_0408530 [marine sediment metagenome]|uniref:Uncharacterized protein n=1 Tax=marine sediment metagenome TaxID=412755 RepID=A0A0F9VGG6_9ZZZZ